MGLPRPSRQIGDRSPTLPLGGGLLIDPEALGQRPQALLTMRIARRTASVVVALPCRTWPIAHPSNHSIRMLHQKLRPNRRQRFKQATPDPAHRPAAKAIVDCRRRPVDGRAILPATASFQNVNDAADHPPIIGPSSSQLVLWKKRLNGSPLRL